MHFAGNRQAEGEAWDFHFVKIPRLIGFGTVHEEEVEAFDQGIHDTLCSEHVDVEVVFDDERTFFFPAFGCHLSNDCETDIAFCLLFKPVDGFIQAMTIHFLVSAESDDDVVIELVVEHVVENGSVGDTVVIGTFIVIALFLRETTVVEAVDMGSDQDNVLVFFDFVSGIEKADFALVLELIVRALQKALDGIDSVECHEFGTVVFAIDGNEIQDFAEMVHNKYKCTLLFAFNIRLCTLFRHGISFVPSETGYKQKNMNRTSVKLTYGLMRGLGKLPLGFHYRFASFFSWVMEKVMKYRKEVIYINLARAFPEKNAQEIDRLAKDFYRHFGEIVAEAIWFSAATPERLRKQQICTMLHPEVFSEAWKTGKSVMCLTSHTGNWELIGGLRSYNPDPSLDEAFDERHIAIAYKQQSSALWDEVLKISRTAPVDHFQGLVETKQILRYAVEHKNEQKLYIFIADQRPYASSTEVGEFMHQHTYGMLGSFKLAHKMGMPVFFSTMARKERGKYEMDFILLTEDASKEEPEQLMKRYFQLLEEEIKATPANYLWSHKRWSQK